MNERRRFLRFQTTLNALCQHVSEKWKNTYKVKNISKEGALLLIDKKMKQGTELDLSVDVPGDNVPIFASCQIQWQKDTSDGKNFETGVRFTKINSADKGKLLEYIYLEWLKLLEKK